MLFEILGAHAMPQRQPLLREAFRHWRPAHVATYCGGDVEAAREQQTRARSRAGRERRLLGNSRAMDNSRKGLDRRPSGSARRTAADAGLPPPLLPVDFGYWKLAPGALGLLGLGVYAGFRKQIKADAVGAEALAGKGVAPLPFSPFHHATRALMYGSALSLGCFSAGVLVVGYSMGVTNLREFSDKMNVWAPEQMHKLGFRHRPEYVKDREAMRGMTYDEEWDFVGKLMEKDDPTLAAENAKAEREREAT
eukprot:jgi/Undpi1/11298/HiC_scaffold_30.g13596.m1